MKKILGLLLFFLGAFQVSASFYIVEVMPNTYDDKNLEYISIRNVGESEADIEGYVLSDASGKEYTFQSEIIDAGEEKQFFRTQTKIILNNTNETLELYSEFGELIDDVSYTTSKKQEVIVFEKEEMEDKNEEGNIKKGEQISEEVFGNLQEEFTLNIDLQRPSYVTQSGSSDTYICDSSRDECKVNLNFLESFSGSYKAADYVCVIDFGLGETTGQEEKCNPNTVIFPKGETQLLLQIFEKDGGVLFFEKEFTFIHDARVAKKHMQQTQSASIHIEKPRIIVQSGLDGMGTNFFCKKQPCKINLEYKTLTGEEGCYWNFGPGTPTTSSSRERCNPGYVEIPEGVFELQLNVHEKDYPSNRRATRFFVHNVVVAQEKQEEKGELSLGQKQEDMPEVQTESIDFNIHLQGKIGKEKKYEGNSLECLGVESCYVNLHIASSETLNSQEYIWKHNGVEFYRGDNPKGQWYETGKHIISAQLQIDGEPFGEKMFEIYIPPIPLKTITAEEKLNTSDIVNANEPLLFADDVPVKSLNDYKDIFTQNFLVLKYDGLRISGKAPKGSEVKIFEGGKEIGVSQANEKGKYRYVSKNFNIGKYDFSTEIYREGEETIVIEKSGSTEIESADIQHWYVSKTKKRKQGKSYKSNKKTPSLIIKKEQKVDVIQNQRDSSENYHIWWMLGTVFVGVILIFHVISLQFSSVYHLFEIRRQQIQFSVKQQVTLIL